MSATRVTSAYRGTGAPRDSSRRRITNLSWACTRASGGGATFTPAATSSSSSSVGTCSWSNVSTVAPSAALAQRVEVGVGTEHHVGSHLRGGIVGPAGEHAERLAERDTRLMRHPGQLASADHRDDGAAEVLVTASMVSCPRPASPTDGFRRIWAPARLLPYTGIIVSFADATIARLPRPLQPFAERHHELIKFAIVGGTTFIIDSAIFYTLKLTILEPKPVTAKIIAGIVAVIASYILNREWSFRDRGGRERHHEALLFFAFSGVGVVLSMIPLWISSYVLQSAGPAGVAHDGEHRRLHLRLRHRQSDADGVPVLGVPPLGVPRRIGPPPGRRGGGRADGRRHRRGDGRRVRGAAPRTRERDPAAASRVDAASRAGQLGDSSVPSVSKTS